MLEFNQLSKIHPNEERERKHLFSNVSASIKNPSIITLLGVSGQGKSTLLRILGLLDVADEGSVSLHGIPVQVWLPMEWRKKVSYVAQHAVMLPISVEDNLRVP